MTFPVGYLCVDGQFLIGEPVRGGVHRGTRVSDGASVVVTHATEIKRADDARRSVDFQLEGVARFLGFGTIDIRSWRPGPGQTDEDADYWEEGDSTPPGDYVCIEAAPGGQPLDLAGEPARLGDIIGIGLTLARIASEAPRAGRHLCAIRPETVWVHPTGAGGWSFQGLTPRSWILLNWGYLSEGMGFDLDNSWIAPDAWDERYGHTLPPDTDAFSVAAVLWYAACRRHPYAPTTREELPEPGVLRTYTGPPELYELLEPMLRYDHADRAPLEHLRRGLEDLARARGLDVPAREPVR